jgi:tryptophan synthase alpha chain
MNRLDQLFDRKHRDILNIYFTAGFPHPDSTERIILALDRAGVDLVEIGMPYSDPMADGPTIQESSMQALRAGFTLDKLFEQLAGIRQQTQIPLVLMGYYNQLIQYGFDRFLEQCRSVGVDGLILPDLPLLEYERDHRAAVEASGLNISFLISPQTTADRIRQIDSVTRGFIYMVSSNAITGAKQGISDAQVAYFERIASMDLEHPRLIGFGISDHESYATACQYANGAIIGSAFIKALDQGGSDNIESTTTDFVAKIRTYETA